MNVPPKQTKAQRQKEHRAAQLEAFKKREAAAKRSRILIIALSILGVLAVVALVATVIIVNNQPKAPVAVPDGVQTFDDLAATHVEGEVDYPMSPPAGGPHFEGWLNCAAYSEPQVNEQAVHSLEHGAVWITYQPDLPAADLATLRDRMPDSYAILSPFPGLDAPMAVSAWGAQLKFSDADDPRFDDFIETYWRAPTAPEPNSPCDGAIDGPGKQ